MAKNKIVCRLIRLKECENIFLSEEYRVQTREIHFLTPQMHETILDKWGHGRMNQSPVMGMADTGPR